MTPFIAFLFRCASEFAHKGSKTSLALYSQNYLCKKMIKHG